MLYQDLRDKWIHEDELINQRTTWLLTTQAFFLGAHGALIAFRKGSAESEEAAIIQAKALLEISPMIAGGIRFDPFVAAGLMLPLIGISLCCHFHRGLRAAFRAMIALREYQYPQIKWGDCAPVQPRIDVMNFLSADGMQASIHLPGIFSLCWGAVLGYEITAICERLHVWEYYRLSFVVISLMVPAVL